MKQTSVNFQGRGRSPSAPLSLGRGRSPSAPQSHHAAERPEVAPYLARSPRRREGFTLVEISMVLILFASAIGGLLSFFPVGLRLENNALSDSAQTMFALDVLAQIEAEAAKCHDWNTWSDDKRFINKVLPQSSYNVGRNNRTFKMSFNEKSIKTGIDGDTGRKTDKLFRTDDDGTLIEHLNSSRDNMRYIIQLSPVEVPIYFGSQSDVAATKNRKMRRVVLWVSDRRDGNPFLNTPFILDLVFQPSLEEIMKGGA